jgi:hypothetical protein
MCLAAWPVLHGGTLPVRREDALSMALHILRYLHDESKATLTMKCFYSKAMLVEVVLAVVAIVAAVVL